MEAVKAEGTARLSWCQAGKVVRKIHNNPFSDHWLNNSKLVPLILELKRIDPAGFYFLETKPLSYEVAGADKDAREFSSLVIIPNGQMKFLEMSSKIVTMDMAHMKGNTNGVICMPTVKDSTKELNSVMLTIFQSETKISYQILYAAFDKIPRAAIILSDKHPGTTIL